MRCMRELTSSCSSISIAPSSSDFPGPFHHHHHHHHQWRRLPSSGILRGYSRPPVILLKAGGGGNKNRGGRGPKKNSSWHDDEPPSSSSKTVTRKTGGCSRAPQVTSNGNSRQKKAQAKPRPLLPQRHTDDEEMDTDAALPRVLVSGAMPVETETVLQTEEPSNTPSWQTFISNLRGVWRGVGAAFSPTTAEMEPIALGNRNEFLYDCRIYSTAEEVQGEFGSKIRRKTSWAVGNPYGEQGTKELEVQNIPMFIDEKAEMLESMEEGITQSSANAGDINAGELLIVDDSLSEVLADEQDKGITKDLESQDLTYDSVMEEDILDLEPGLVFFEDGSYSRGPLQLITEAPLTYRIEQCLVKGGHTRLRLVHTITVEAGGEEVQLLRVAVYEEEWMGPNNMKSISDSGGHHLKLFSQRERLLPQELVGSWKVFEVSATAVIPDDGQQSDRPPYVYLSMETQKRRLLPEMPVHFADEDLMDMQDVTVLWLPGAITAYVHIKDDGLLTIGVGWYSDGVNLVMERDYNTSGKLCEVHTKTEVKGGWKGGRM